MCNEPHVLFPDDDEDNMMVVQYQDEDAQDGYRVTRDPVMQLEDGSVIPFEPIAFHGQALEFHAPSPIVFVEDSDSQSEEGDSDEEVKDGQEVFHGIVEEPTDSDSGLESAGSEVDVPDPLFSLSNLQSSDIDTSSNIEVRRRSYTARPTISPPAPPTTPSDIPVSIITFYSNVGKKRKFSENSAVPDDDQLQTNGVNCDSRGAMQSSYNGLPKESSSGNSRSHKKHKSYWTKK